jgi:hypothetical protein
MILIEKFQKLAHKLNVSIRPKTFCSMIIFLSTDLIISFFDSPQNKEQYHLSAAISIRNVFESLKLKDKYKGIISYRIILMEELNVPKEKIPYINYYTDTIYLKKKRKEIPKPKPKVNNIDYLNSFIPKEIEKYKELIITIIKNGNLKFLIDPLILIERYNYLLFEKLLETNYRYFNNIIKNFFSLILFLSSNKNTCFFQRNFEIIKDYHKYFVSYGTFMKFFNQIEDLTKNFHDLYYMRGKLKKEFEVDIKEINVLDEFKAYIEK